MKLTTIAKAWVSIHLHGKITLHNLNSAARHRQNHQIPAPNGLWGKSIRVKLKIRNKVITMQETKGKTSLWSFCVFGKENRMEYISIFENDLRENDKAEKSIESYIGAVRGFVGFLCLKGITLERILDLFAVNSYQTQLLQENYEPASINKSGKYREILLKPEMVETIKNTR